MRVPVYEVGQVGARPLPVVPQDATAGVANINAAAGIGEAAARAGSQISAIGEHEKALATAAVVLDASAGFDADSLTLLNDPKTGAFTRRGKDAIGIADAAGADLEKARLARRAALTSEQARRTFDAQTIPQTIAARRALMNHEDQQGRAVGIEAAQSRIASQIELAAANYTDPATIEQARLSLRAAVFALSALRGDDQETEQRTLAQAQSRFHAGVLAEMADDPQTAHAYLDAHRDEMLSADRAESEKAVKVGAVRQTAQQLADAAWEGAGGDFSAAMEKARTIEDVALRDETESRIRERANDFAAGQAQARKAVRDRADEAFKVRHRVSDVPAETWAAMSSDEQSAYKRDEKSWQETAGAGITADQVTPATWKDWYAYQRMSPQEQASVDLYTRFKGKLPTSMWAQMAAEQGNVLTAIRNSGDKPPDFTELQTKSGIVKTVAQRAGIIPFAEEAPDEGEARSYAKFLEDATREIQVFEREKLGGKRQATVDEAQMIAESLAVRGDYKSPTLKRESPFVIHPASPAAPSDLVIPRAAIPADERAKIEEALRLTGRAVTEEAVRALYRRKFGTTGGIR